LWQTTILELISGFLDPTEVMLKLVAKVLRGARQQLNAELRLIFSKISHFFSSL